MLSARKDIADGFQSFARGQKHGNLATDQQSVCATDCYIFAPRQHRPGRPCCSRHRPPAASPPRPRIPFTPRSAPSTSVAATARSTTKRPARRPRSLPSTRPAPSTPRPVPRLGTAHTPRRKPPTREWSLYECDTGQPPGKGKFGRRRRSTAEH